MRHVASVSNHIQNKTQSSLQGIRIWVDDFRQGVVQDHSLVKTIKRTASNRTRAFIPKPPDVHAARLVLAKTWSKLHRGCVTVAARECAWHRDEKTSCQD